MKAAGIGGCTEMRAPANRNGASTTMDGGEASFILVTWQTRCVGLFFGRYWPSFARVAILASARSRPRIAALARSSLARPNSDVAAPRCDSRFISSCRFAVYACAARVTNIIGSVRFPNQAMGCQQSPPVQQSWRSILLRNDAWPAQTSEKENGETAVAASPFSNRSTAGSNGTR